MYSSRPGLSKSLAPRPVGSGRPSPCAEWAKPGRNSQESPRFFGRFRPAGCSGLSFLSQAAIGTASSD